MNPGDDFAEIVRGALHAEADSVMPSPDALDRIRARTAAEPRWSWSWFMGDWSRPVLAAGAAALMAAVAVSGGPAALDRFTSAGQNSRAEQEARHKSAHPDHPGRLDGLPALGPGGQPLPAGMARVACAPVTPNPTATVPTTAKRTQQTPTAAPSTVPESAWKSLSCPPSTTPTLVPSPTGPVTPAPTGTVPATPTTVPVTPPPA
ncbi:MAG: hypothetical protein ABIQ26_07555, partial [Streptosporangiaceae bacterium]